MRSDEVLGDMQGNAENGDAERDRQCGMQEVAEIFVELEECHGIIPFCGSPSAAGDRSDQVRDDAQGDSDERKGERDRQGGMQEVAEIFVVEDGHRAVPWICPP